jgi:beta-phosphoglucomutase-like phosphatase (HAD superfamily)
MSADRSSEWWASAVLFDLDGVLVDATEWHYKSLNVALREVSGTEIRRREHLAVFNGLPTRVKLARLVSDGRVREGDVPEIVRRKQEATVRVIQDQCRRDPSKVALVQSLARHFRVGCVTNSIRATAELMLEKAGLLTFMETIVSNEDATRPKPSPDGYIIAMYQLRALPSRTLIVEDSPFGVQAARDSGGHVLAVAGPTDVTKERIATALREFMAFDLIAADGELGSHLDEVSR